MDIVSHALWAGAATELLRRRGTGSRRLVALSVGLGVLPDVLQILPIAAWSLTQPSPAAVLQSFIAALPGTEPHMPDMIRFASHQLHCVMHSAVILTAVSLFVWRMRPGLLIALVGWWAHVALDIPTHSADYYAVPFLYPLTYWAFDGIPWTTPWVLITNYAALAATYIGLVAYRSRRQGPRSQPH